MCAIAAPARAASSAASAICSGVTGTRSLLPTVSPTPVTAHVTKTSQFILCTLTTDGGRCEQSSEHSGRARRPAELLGAPLLRQPRRAGAAPRATRRGGHRLRARALRIAALRALARLHADRAPALAHRRDRQRGRAPGRDADL